MTARSLVVDICQVLNTKTLSLNAVAFVATVVAMAALSAAQLESSIDVLGWHLIDETQLDAGDQARRPAVINLDTPPLGAGLFDDYHQPAVSSHVPYPVGDVFFDATCAAQTLICNAPLFETTTISLVAKDAPSVQSNPTSVSRAHRKEAAPIPEPTMVWIFGLIILVLAVISYRNRNEST